ncbi:MAG: hypothetical protein IJ019_06490 [Alphaproteobacteria bacterium]|nr:hypothetical protein [Alphaproteobacteria bacterium]
MTFWPISEITVADRGIREGMLLDMMHSQRQNRFGKKPKRRNRLYQRGGYHGKRKSGSN